MHNTLLLISSYEFPGSRGNIDDPQIHKPQKGIRPLEASDRSLLETPEHDFPLEVKARA